MNEQNEVNSDYELLRNAAKAAGLMADGWHRDGGIAVWMPGQESKYWFNWNPLTDDGDAFRLIVKCLPFYTVCYSREDYEACNQNGLAATRLAIVRAAAEIGRNMA
jgi:hypothetical protein